MTTRYQASRADIERMLEGQPRYRIDQVWRGLYDELSDPADMTALPKDLRAVIDERLPRALELVTEHSADRGETVKFLWQLDGGSRIETVLMLYPDRATVCVSTQAGCAMACGFCATGQAGFTRHLTAGEILEQVVRRTRSHQPSLPHSGSDGGVRRVSRGQGTTTEFRVGLDRRSQRPTE